jgi:hypothetical protein
MIAELMNISTQDVGVLAFGIVVIREMVSVIKEMLSYAKAKNGNGGDNCAMSELRKQVNDIDHRLSRLEGELDA